MTLRIVIISQIKQLKTIKEILFQIYILVPIQMHGFIYRKIKKQVKEQQVDVIFQQ